MAPLTNYPNVAGFIGVGVEAVKGTPVAASQSIAAQVSRVVANHSMVSIWTGLSKQAGS